jgi:zinc D-Ala-D-Ala carboxypeptidase
MRNLPPRLHAVRSIAVAALLGASLMIVPAAAPAPVRGLGPLPDCRLDDILTIPRGYGDWRHTLVDWILSVGPGYKPPDLVSVQQGNLFGGGQVRKLVIPDLRAMAAAAAARGTPLGSWSAYRSYTTQVSLFNGYAGWNGKKYTNFDDAIQFSARPGHSEHQLGLTIDFTAAGLNGMVGGTSAAGKWLAANAWKYGWLMSYPPGKQDVTCYSYEPWHFRYYGRELAAKIHASGLTTREYLWANYTYVDAVTGLPVATPTPVPSPPASVEASGEGPSDSPSASPAATPAATAAETSPPSSPAGTWFGLDPPVVIAALLLVLVSVGLIASVGLARRRARR